VLGREIAEKDPAQVARTAEKIRKEGVGWSFECTPMERQFHKKSNFYVMQKKQGTQREIWATPNGGPDSNLMFIPDLINFRADKPDPKLTRAWGSNVWQGQADINSKVPTPFIYREAPDGTQSISVAQGPFNAAEIDGNLQDQAYYLYTHMDNRGNLVTFKVIVDKQNNKSVDVFQTCGNNFGFSVLRNHQFKKPKEVVSVSKASKETKAQFLQFINDLSYVVPPPPDL